jgi:hypothetical protein
MKRTSKQISPKKHQFYWTPSKKARGYPTWPVVIINIKQRTQLKPPLPVTPWLSFCPWKAYKHRLRKPNEKEDNGFLELWIPPYFYSLLSSHGSLCLRRPGGSFWKNRPCSIWTVKHLQKLLINKPQVIINKVSRWECEKDTVGRQEWNKTWKTKIKTRSVSKTRNREIFSWHLFLSSFICLDLTLPALHLPFLTLLTFVIITN